jgi:hypothetical protein
MTVACSLTLIKGKIRREPVWGNRSELRDLFESLGWVLALQAICPGVTAASWLVF